MRRHLFFESLSDVKFKGTSNSLELEAQILCHKNSKLIQSFKFVKNQVNELKRRINTFEERKDADDSIIALINKSWNQYNVELLNIVHHYHIDQVPLEQGNIESLQTFQKKLCANSTNQLEVEMKNRILQSLSLIKSISSALERLAFRSDKMNSFLEQIRANPKPHMKEFSLELIAELTAENSRLHSRLAQVELQNNELQYELNENRDYVTSSTNKLEEMNRKVDEINYNLTQEQMYSVKLEFSLQQAHEEVDRLTSLVPREGQPQVADEMQAQADNQACEKLKLDLQYAESLASSRLKEIDEMKAENDKLSQQLEVISSTENGETPEIGIEVAKLKRQLAASVSETKRLKTRLDQTKEELFQAKFTVGQLMDDNKNEKNNITIQSLDEIKRLDQIIASKEKECECLKLENSQLSAISESTYNVHKEMRHLINSFQSYNKQLKSENVKYQAKINERFAECPRVAPVESNSADFSGAEQFENELKAADRVERVKELAQEALARWKKSISVQIDSQKRISELRGYIDEQKRKIVWHQQQEETFMQEMEVTGEALEDMQEKNRQLIEQQTSREQAYVNLLSERIKEKQLMTMMGEEKKAYTEHEALLRLEIKETTQLTAQLRDKEASLYKIINNLESESKLKEERIELGNRRYNDTLQKCDEFKIMSDYHYNQLKEAQQALSEKSSVIRSANYRERRLEEEVAGLRSQLDKLSKIRGFEDNETSLMDEIKELKDRLLCPCCHVHKKNAVLTNCFHVFCLECLTNLYQTRKRKCPKCNALFDANEFKRLWFD